MYQTLHHPRFHNSMERASIFFLLGLGLLFPSSHSGAAIFGAALLLFTLCAGFWVDAYKVIRTNHLALLFILFFGLVLLSTSYGTVDFRAALFDVKKYLRFATIPILMVLFQRSTTRKLAIHLFLAIMTAICLIAYAKYFGFIHYKSSQPNEVFMNRIETSFMFAFAAFLLMHYALDSVKHRIIYAAGLLLLSCNLLFINTARTGLLIFISLAALFLWQRVKTRTLLIITPLLITTIAFIMLLSPTLRTFAIDNSIRDITQYQKNQYETSLGARLTFAKYGLQIAAHHPILGTGVGSHRTEYAKYDVPTFHNGLSWGDPHNQYIFTFFELGGVGLALLLYILFIQWRLSYQLPRETQYLAQGLVLSITLGNCCDSLLFLSSTGLFYAYFTGLLYAPLIKPSFLTMEHS